MVLQHPPGEAENHPALQDERVLAPAVVLEDLQVVLVQPPVDLDDQSEVPERDVQEADLPLQGDGPVGLPPPDPRCAQEPVGESFRGRPGLIAGVEEQRPTVAVPPATADSANASQSPAS